MRVLPQSPVLSLDPPILTAFARRNAFAMHDRLTREGSPSLRSPPAPARPPARKRSPVPVDPG
jgi:hypothetical protein